MAKHQRFKPITTIDDPRYVKAMAHPLRIRILALLTERDASPVALAHQLDTTLGRVAYHVRTLEQLGLIELVATHQRRGATEHVYAARERPRFSDSAWAASSPITKQVMMSAVLSQVGEYVTRSAAAGGFERSDAHFTRTALKLDEEGWSELAGATKQWLAQVQEIEDRTTARVARTGEQPLDAGLVVMFFQASPLFDESEPSASPSRTGREPRLRHSAP